MGFSHTACHRRDRMSDLVDGGRQTCMGRADSTEIADQRFLASLPSLNSCDLWPQGAAWHHVCPSFPFSAISVLPGQTRKRVWRLPQAASASVCSRDPVSSDLWPHLYHYPRTYIYLLPAQRSVLPCCPPGGHSATSLCTVPSV